MVKARLYEKLQQKRLPARVVSWIQAFLAHRKARVRADGVVSRFHSFEEGCPQGTVLGLGGRNGAQWSGTHAGGPPPGCRILASHFSFQFLIFKMYFHINDLWNH